MKEDIEKATVEFDNKASKIYSEVFAEFYNSVSKIRRDKEENVFKMQVSKYTQTLKDKLEGGVKSLLNNCHPQIHNSLETVLSAKINYYLQEFWQKCNSL